MKDEPRPIPTSRHQLDHAVPTVIHHPDDDLPILARWLKQAMANQTRFWSLLVGSVLAIVVLVVLANGLSLGHSNDVEAWTKLETAKTPAERVEIAREFAKTPAERWALLQAATEYYNQGFMDLPANRDVALPTLKKALDLFEEVAREAPADSPPARLAALGVARTLEARKELSKAIEQYEKVAKTWPESSEGKEAERLAKALKQDDNVKFYEQLYAYKPNQVTLPPEGSERFGLPSGHPPIDGSMMRMPSPLMLPPPPTAPDAGRPVGKVGTLPELPPDIFTPGEPPAKTASPKAETPKSELPADVFAPK